MRKVSSSSAWHIVVLLMLLLAGFLAPVSRTRAASVIYVNAGASGANTGSSWANAYTSLQAALSAATSGSELWVATGTYRPAGPGGDRNASFALKSGVALYGGFAGTETQRDQRDWAGNPTILSGDLSGNDGLNFANNAENSYHVVLGGGADGTAILDGFTISAGNADSSTAYPRGGGMYNENSSPTLTNVIFSGNTSQWGGGMANLNSSPTLNNVRFSSNATQQDGSGMHNERSSPTLTNVIFSGNTSQTSGGGMFNWQSSNPALTNVTFSGNSAWYGGGMANVSSNPTLTNVTFSDNTAPYNGGGMFNSASHPTLTNVTFSGNTSGYGGGMHNSVESNPTLTNVTFSGNTAQWGGGGLSNTLGSHPTVQNSILWGNAAPESSQIFSSQSTLTVDTSIVQGGYPGGSGILDVDPLFVAPVPAGSAPTTAGDLHLRPASPAIDAGDTTVLPAGVTTDRDGMPRVIGPRVDLGAFEAHAQLNLSKTVDRPSAGPTERITYRLVLDNTGAYSSTVTLSDTLPTGLTYAGPVTVEPVGGTVGPPPTLVRDLVIRGGQTVTVMLPVDVDVGQPAGTVISNTASLSGTDALNTSTSTAAVTVLNLAPRTADDLGCISPGQSVGLPVLRNDLDPNGDPLHITSVSTPNSGTATSDGTVITYTPAVGFAGTASFNYSASDGSLSTSASVRVTITADIHGACTLYLPLIVQAVDR